MWHARRIAQIRGQRSTHQHDRLRAEEERAIFSLSVTVRAERETRFDASRFRSRISSRCAWRKRSAGIIWVKQLPLLRFLIFQHQSPHVRLRRLTPVFLVVTAIEARRTSPHFLDRNATAFARVKHRRHRLSYLRLAPEHQASVSASPATVP